MKTKLIRTTLALSVAVALFLPLVARAETTERIDTGTRGPLPHVQVTDDPHLLFEVQNTTAQPMHFAVPVLGINETLLPHSEQTVHVDTSKTPQKQFMYQLQDDGGRQMASGMVENHYRFASDINLSNIINYSTAYQAESKPEPRYYDKRHIRGYW